MWAAARTATFETQGDEEWRAAATTKPIGEEMSGALLTMKLFTAAVRFPGVV